MLEGLGREWWLQTPPPPGDLVLLADEAHLPPRDLRLAGYRWARVAGEVRGGAVPLVLAGRLTSAHASDLAGWAVPVIDAEMAGFLAAAPFSDHPRRILSTELEAQAGRGDLLFVPPADGFARPEHQTPQWFLATGPVRRQTICGRETAFVPVVEAFGDPWPRISLFDLSLFQVQSAVRFVYL